MSNDIVTRLEELASNYKTTEFEFVHADYETVCEASYEIERLRAEVVRLGSFIHPIGTVIGREAVRGE